jgi:hypothetical protein
MKNSTLELLKLDMLKGLSGRVVGVDVVGAVVVGGTLLVSLAPTVLLLLFWDLWVLCTTLTGLEVVLTSIGNDWSRIEAVGMKGNPLKLTVGWGPGGDACVVLVVSPEFGVDVAVAVVSVLVVAVVVVVDAFGRSVDRLNWASTWIGMPAWTTAECWIRMGRQSSGRGGGVRTRMMMSLREW